jgi:tetratricopeptide (TPR) repeat protein
MKIRQAAIISAFLAAVAAPAAVAHDDTPPPSGRPPELLGKVHFPTSCDARVQPAFERGVALLHSFWFPEARKVFMQVVQDDPSCAIAYWGIGVNRLLNPFGGQPPEKALLEGQAAVDKGLATPAKTQRERDYVEAIASLYAHDRAPWNERVLRYEQAMERLVARYPNDAEAAIFYALALNVAADPNDKTYARQLKAAAILEPIFAKQPDHPGVAHYLIHSYDYPPIAHKGQSAAHKYAAIAPSAAHALHMPSHIFTRTGSWEESIGANRRSEETARKNATPDEILHALDYQVYAALQLGRDADARQAIERMQPEAGRYERVAGAFALAAGPARYAMERGDWKMAARLEPRPSKYPYVDAMTHFSRAVGAARLGDAGAAEKDAARLAELRDAMVKRKDAYWAAQIEVQRLSAEAWIMLAKGQRDHALALMRQSAELQDKGEKSPVTPGYIGPSREMLGEMLLELKRPAEALKEFELAVAHDLNRLRGFQGAARAAAQSGNAAAARKYYERLVAMTAKADGRPELQEAKAWLARN